MTKSGLLVHFEHHLFVAKKHSNIPTSAYSQTQTALLLTLISHPAVHLSIRASSVWPWHCAHRPFSVRIILPSLKGKSDFIHWEPSPDRASSFPPGTHQTAPSQTAGLGFLFRKHSLSQVFSWLPSFRCVQKPTPWLFLADKSEQATLSPADPISFSVCPLPWLTIFICPSSYCLAHFLFYDHWLSNYSQ